eukprot:4498739-Alexandrium_andersonii.AAC.1
MAAATTIQLAAQNGGSTPTQSCGLQLMRAGPEKLVQLPAEEAARTQRSSRCRHLAHRVGGCG